jgi:Uma2 family endonuclease
MNAVSLAQGNKISIAEYLLLEKNSSEKHEYHSGRIVAMAGGTPEHSLISNNIGAALHQSLKGKKCIVYNSDLQVAVSRTRYVYADGTVVCGKRDFYEDNNNAVKNPTLIVEVLSSSTADYDRNEKLLLYLQIPSFQEYILIRQDIHFVQVFYKQQQGKWEMSMYDNLSQTIHLQSISVDISMIDIYENIDL